MSAMSAVYIQQKVWRVTRSHDRWHVLSTLKRTITKSTLHVVWRYRILVCTPLTYCARCMCDFNMNCTAIVACTTNAHSVTDNEYFWMDLKQITYMNMSAVKLMASYHAVDIHWVLGGRICGVRLHDSFVFPHVQLIEDHPYSTFLLLTIIKTKLSRTAGTLFTSTPANLCKQTN